VRIKLEGYRCMPAPHALCSKMLAERTASRNVFVLFYFIYLLPIPVLTLSIPELTLPKPESASLTPRLA